METGSSLSGVLKEYGWSYDVPTIRVSTVQPDLPFEVFSAS